MRSIATLGALWVAVLFAACTEKPQTAGTRKADEQPWATAQTAYVANGWKQGDHAAWEQQLRQRAQGQNEYTRAPAPSR